jgi:hypothetical protein
MTRFLETSAAALILLAASVTFPAAQVSGGSGSSGSAGSSSSGGSSVGSGGGSVTGAPPVSAPSSTPTSAVPSPATDPNNQVAPSAVGLPGGGSSVPQSPGSGIGSHVPVYGTQDASGIGNSINKSEQRSSSTDCTGTGTKSSTGSGSTSTTTSNCAGSSSSGGLGTTSIMGGSGSIDVNR